jgi:SAM-dependent methyltransferase
LADVLSDLYDDTLLNDAYEELMNGDVSGALKDLESGLNEMLLSSSEPEWKGFAQFCLAHPIRGLLHQDPFTLQAFEKPRGYGGDAGLLEFIYGVEDGKGPPLDTTKLGQEIFQYTTGTAICDALRARARTVADAIDRLADESNRPEILSLAAGHLREAHLSDALQQGRLGRWLALDTDAETLAEVRELFAGNNVDTLAGTVRQILTGKLEPGQFDFIYSTGLYGYLDESIARRLTSCLFEMLRPGGKLMVANFSPEIRERGYMESFMDWHLTCRARREIRDLAADIDETQTSEIRLLADDNPSIVFLSATKN